NKCVWRSRTSPKPASPSDSSLPAAGNPGREFCRWLRHGTGQRHTSLLAADDEFRQGIPMASPRENHPYDPDHHRECVTARWSAADRTQSSAVGAGQVTFGGGAAEKAEGLAQFQATFPKELLFVSVGHTEDPWFTPVGRVVVLRNVRKLLEHVDRGATRKVHDK